MHAAGESRVRSRSWLSVAGLARPLLASMFVIGGVDALMNPAPKVGKAKDVGPEGRRAARAPRGSGDAGQDQRCRPGRRRARCSPSASCRGWRRSRSPPRSSRRRSPATGSGRRRTSGAAPLQRIQFFKNVSMLGGLLLAAVDTEGRPSLSWRAHRAAGTRRRPGRRRRRPRRAELDSSLERVTGGRRGTGGSDPAGPSSRPGRARRSRSRPTRRMAGSARAADR